MTDLTPLIGKVSVFGKQTEVAKQDSWFVVLKPIYHQESDSFLYLTNLPPCSCLPLDIAS